MNRTAACIFLSAVLCMMCATTAAFAARLPEDLAHTIKQTFKGCKIRIDGAIEMRDGTLFLPIIPPIEHETADGGTTLTFAGPAADVPDVLTFDDGYCFIKLKRIGTYRTVSLPPNLPDSVQHQVITGQLPSDLVVPEAFVLPGSLAAIKDKLDVRVIPDKVLAAQGTPGTAGGAHQGESSKQPAEPAAAAISAILVTSVRSGSITMLDAHTLEKIAEFPTEGTPTGLVYAGGKAYIADQGKNRVLILDCEKREFLGQINLLPKSAPQGIAKLPNGRLLYLSESSAGDIAVIETATHKILLRTKVAVGPSKITITPNGEMVLVLHGPSGLLSILSTANQRLLMHLKVGNAPGNIAVTSDSRVAYVSNRNSNSITVVDLGRKQLTGSIATGADPTGLVLSKDNLTLYVVNARENSLGIYDTRNRKRINLLKLPADTIDFPSNITLSPDGKRLFITSEGTGSLAVFNTESQSFDKAIQIGCPTHQVLFIP